MFKQIYSPPMSYHLHQMSHVLLHVMTFMSHIKLLFGIYLFEGVRSKRERREREREREGGVGVSGRTDPHRRMEKAKLKSL